MGYRIDDMKVSATHEEIVDAIEHVKSEDMFGEMVSTLLSFLPFSVAKQYLIPEATEDEWPDTPTDEAFRETFRHYAGWWREKIVDERGLSCWRGRDQFAMHMMLAGLAEWKFVYDLGGWYSQSAYKLASDLFDDLEPIDEEDGA